MKGIIGLCMFALCGLASGCETPFTTCGFRFEVLKPPVMLNPSAVVGGSGGLALAGVSTVPVAHELTSRSMVKAAAPSSGECEEAPAPRPYSLSRKRLPSAPTCTLEEACRRLEALERTSPAKGTVEEE